MNLHTTVILLAVQEAYKTSHKIEENVMTPHQATLIMEVLEELSQPAMMKPVVEEAFSSEEAEREARVQARMSGGGRAVDIEGTKYDFAVERQQMPAQIATHIASALSNEESFLDLEFVAQTAFIERCRNRGLIIYSLPFRDVAVTRDDGSMYLKLETIRQSAQLYRDSNRMI